MGRRKVGKTIIIQLLLFSFLVGLLSVQTIQAADNSLALEQAYVYLPEIHIYVNGAENYGKLDESQIEVYRGDEKLSLSEIKKFSQLDEGVFYYVLLDISGSIRDSYFSDIKNALESFQKKLDKKDKMALITFGENVAVQLTGDESAKEASKKISKLQNADDRTLLFEALAQAGDMAASMTGTEYKRKIVIVISDGEDIARGKSTKQEALDELKSQGLPVYAMAVDYEGNKVLDSFGEFARNTGGDIQIFNQTGTKKCLNKIQKKIENSDVLLLKSNNNNVSQSMETLTVQFHQWTLTKTIDAGFYHWQSDDEIPQITEISQEGNYQLKVAFSEEVSGGKEPSNYQLKEKENNTVYTPVSVEELEDNTKLLTFEEEFYRGDYLLETVNIMDVSMEKNEVGEGKEVSLEGRKKDSAAVVFLKNHGYLIAAAAILVLLAVMLVVYRKIKKNKGVIVVDDKMTMAANVDVKRHVAMEQQKQNGVTLTFTMKTKGRYPAVTKVLLDDSLIVGRSDICEVYFDDEQMSRQHFALEYKEGIIFIMDLDTTNGTIVNGVRISGKQKLEKRDTVCAGTVEMMIDWGSDD